MYVPFSELLVASFRADQPVIRTTEQEHSEYSAILF